GEACDLGANNNDVGACTLACKAATCGDGLVWANMEQCDDGPGNNADNKACKADCTKNICGDGKVGPAETCDDGNQNNNDTCTNVCKPAACGDGFPQPGEQCDDGNQIQTDSCLISCLSAKCGDGQVQAGVDECDDGNQVQTDACLNSCKNAKCGDGQLRAGVEQCDDGNTNNNDGCSATCNLEVNMVCLNPLSLNLANRNRNFNDGGNTLYCDLSGWANPNANDWTTPDAWYRFTGGAGTRMPTSPPPELSCGTHAPGWMVGTYPAVNEGIVQRTVCYNWSGNTCLWSNPIQVVNCGGYYVFKLPNVAVNCWLRYCGEN
ncbi:MAG: DUF4215 domain-containing protein, partial [Myxococcales bacterium]|nr:DUF4215 domain-containing protein [Myxococcales bacterium]